MTSHGTTVAKGVWWGLGAAVAGFSVGAVGAWLDGRLWYAFWALVVAGVVLMARGRWLLGAIVLVGSVVGFFAFWWWLLWVLNRAGALG